MTEQQTAAFAGAQQTEAVSSENIPGFFARGVNFYKLFWVFLGVSFLGCLAETAFMLLTRGELQNRSGVIYGSFSLVWGLGAVLFTVCFHRLAGRSSFLILLAGTALGAVYEYACSWLQEVLFGACFWDYSHLPFNINGRVNLVFSLFWGVAAVLWVKRAYPAACRWIGKIPNRAGRPLTLALAVLMVFDIGLTSAALGRMNQRQHDIPAAGPVAEFLDLHYPDRRLEAIFTNLTYIGTDEAREAAGVPRPNDLPGQ
ncbi:putative ABC transporter permease [uncultured Pseudoflavonifractor sp.]|uniref:putative ABC transporter permease n=1 Tax=uncultured Pseudoflavonifractor sp. TaxID=1221379 RepID=UPI0025CDB5F9|nr:putative ABC transporter permease [uncultured Pseudoflavonifractor sp.]